MEPLNEDLEAMFNFESPNENCRFFIAKENGEIVGFSRVHFYGWNKSAYVISLLVNIGYRRRGINSLLLRVVEDFARENGAHVLMFDTAIDNIPALSLYLKNGIKICGYNEKLYGNAKIALYLAKEL
ncbi:GNAT family N-acetyltransferase [Candidatus Bathyarchaeota archaeon]|nr:GNAT family N-acetyltransferase [Candidatus Bathyarchaeota archaeon]